ncbi:MAG: N-acetyltransferase family protein [bacterium]
MTTSFVVRELTVDDVAKLERFLLLLPDTVYDLWNRFGFSSVDFTPKEVAYTQCTLPPSLEKGFIAINETEEAIAYSYLRFFPGKKTKKSNASLGIVVAPAYQGQGVGMKLMHHMHNWAKKNKIKKIWLATYSRNKPALNLYKRLGYEIEGIFVYDEFGHHGWDHVVSMALMLDEKLYNANEIRESIINEIEKDTNK